MDCAILNSDRQYTYFSFRNQTIRFRTSRRLEQYTEVLEWDFGYIVVMAKYESVPAMEDYIDLIPILEDLYIDANEFLSPIQKVRIQYD
ncbi:MAG: hypothetical protein LUI14_05935 [Lachnospiraceae bacterium]|nr:hypothetical protein [Lachnospiraceae bacterium]